MKILCSLFASIVFVSVTIFGLVRCDKASPSLHGHKDPEVILNNVDGDGDEDSPLKLVGERLFRESRFSQYFFANSNGILTKMTTKGDPVVENLETLTKILENPYRGQAMSCAACHFVDQAKNIDGAGSRAYTDFTHRSPIPDRGDGGKTTVRNSPNMVGMAIKDGMFLHHDGEFNKPEDLVRASYLGRNMGWLVPEKNKAIHHIAQVIRSDDGSYPTETDLGGLNYRDLFAGASNIPPRFQVPAEYRMDITKASDEEIFNGLVKLVGGYLRTLDYAKDKQGHYKGSPYDAFLRKNNLPLAPNDGESAVNYSLRLADLVNNLKNVAYVSNADSQLKLHKQDFAFTEKELTGFKVFFGKGQCIQCHSAPDFTDHLFHNTGASQDDYDRVHGDGAFMKLAVPSLADRNKNAELYLPSSEQFPNAQSLMRSVPSKDDPRRADLGAWVVFGNPAMPNPQAEMRNAICQSVKMDCAAMTDDQVLSHALGMVKTATVRDLGQSQPYLHTGQANAIEDVLVFYIKYSALAKAKMVRNGDPQLENVNIEGSDFAAVSAFLKSLNEDYD